MKKILLYNFSEEKLLRIKSAAEPFNSEVLVIENTSCGQQLGYLMGAAGYRYNADASYEDFNDELLVMSGFDRNDIDSFIKSLHTNGAGRIALKAILTPTNIKWSISELYKAVKSDHDKMREKPKG